MKLFSLLCAAFVGMAVLAPSTASARPYGGGERTRVTHDRCGNRVFWVYAYAGRDRHGCAVYRWVQQGRSSGHGGYDRGHGGYDRGHGGRDRGHGGYDRGHDGCDRRDYGRTRSGISFQWSR